MNLPDRNESGWIDAEPGIYPGVPFPRYRLIRAMNKSAITSGFRSQVHLLHDLEHPEEWRETYDLRFGKLLHLGLLEPDRYAVEVSDAAPVNPKTKSFYGFETAAWAQAERDEGKMLVTRDDAKRLAEMIARIRAHKAAAALLASAGTTEVVCVWDCPVTGVRCKARIDLFAPRVALLDIKTTEDASPLEFEWSVAKYGYHVQGAFYTDGWRVQTGEEHPFGIIAAEKHPPFGVAVYELTPRAIARGRGEYRQVLRAYARCLQTGVFHGYPEDAVTLDLKRWDEGPSEAFEERRDEDPFATRDDPAAEAALFQSLGAKP